ncbi:MAG: hypothetical protein LBS10_11260 [Gracilibacteraceae bacterium]|jgi:hypothetical protein|nr:hypothetical protein [Gracilibacteraceae bacterium]
MPAVIKHQLALAVRLSDVTDGRGVENDVTFWVNGTEKSPRRKTNGFFIYTDPALLAQDYDLEVRARGYVPARRRILLEAPGVSPPDLRLELVPEEDLRTAGLYFSLAGRLPGLTAIDAVSADDTACRVKHYDARRRRLTVFNPHRLEFERALYALVQTAETRYVPFAPEGYSPDGTLKTDRSLTLRGLVNLPLTPVVAGITGPEGDYLLRVRKNAAGNRWIVRLRLNEADKFAGVDFNKPAAWNQDEFLRAVQQE